MIRIEFDRVASSPLRVAPAGGTSLESQADVVKDFAVVVDDRRADVLIAHDVRVHEHVRGFR